MELVLQDVDCSASPGCRGRQGLHNTVDIDQDNAHFLAQLERHPGRPALLRYTREKDGIRGVVAEATKVCRQKAKRLFLQICYGGSVASWCSEHGVAPSDVPSFVFEFAAEQVEIRAADALM